MLVSKENRSGVSVLHIGDLSSVGLFILPGELMLLDASGLIVVDVREGHYTILDVAAHFLRVDVNTGRSVLDQIALADELAQVVSCVLVDWRGVRVGSIWKFEISATHSEEAHFVIACNLAGLLRVHHVVWWR